MTMAADEHIRPTLRALTDLGSKFPPLTTALHTIDAPLVQKAQRIPSTVAAGGGERIFALTDRVWFKVKVNEERGVVTNARVPGSLATSTDTQWWIGACGRRRGTAPNDFYVQLQHECARAGKGTGTVNSDHLLPQPVDIRRLVAETAAFAVVSLKTTIREAIARSAHDGDLWRVSVAGHGIGALVRSEDGDTYLAITADGYYDAHVVAVILDAVPGVQPDDWQAEPSTALQITPEAGQIVFSTMIPPESLASLLDEFEAGFL